MTATSISVAADDLGTLYEVWRALEHQADQARASADAAKAKIRELLTVHAPEGKPSTVIGTIDGTPRVQLITSERRGLDTKLLKQDHPELAAEYETVTLVSTLRAVTPKKAAAR